MWTLIFLAALATQDRHDTAAERVVFPDEEALQSWRRRGDREKRLVALLTERKHWAAAFREIDEKLGLFSDESRVRVMIEDLDETWPAQGGGRNGKGAVRFNMRKLVEYQKKEDEHLRLVASGKKLKVIVPPTRLETILTHELVHVFCGTLPENWLTEGMACWAAGDTALFYGFNHRGARVEPLDRAVPAEDAYARGMLFFAWLEEQHGRGKVRELVARVREKSEAGGAAAAAVIGREWASLLPEEKTWSEKHLAKFKPAK